MGYSHTINTNKSIEQIKEKLHEELGKEGFGQLFEIHLSEKLNTKLNLSLEYYSIHGVCNPPVAYKALNVEKQIGLFLPCNIIIYIEFGKTYVATSLPSKMMKIANNEELDIVAKDIENKLVSILDKLT